MPETAIGKYPFLVAVTVNDVLLEFADTVPTVLTNALVENIGTKPPPVIPPLNCPLKRDLFLT